MENQSSSSFSSLMETQFLILDQVRFLDVNEDTLSQWELVDLFDVEEEWGEQCDDGNIVDDGFNYADSSPISYPNVDPIEGIGNFIPRRDVVDHDHGHRDNNDDDEEVECVDDEDDDDDDDGYDLDDELVPWNVGNRFERQRMRKLGKRACSKMNNSKRNPYLYTRPGCVRGKHGLGLKHTY
ncbi:hypothetical protein HN51_034379 [Arachis hypogaea]|uniref:nuclear polyadenylated RNA-binding protein 3 n=1 Tax=Arachis ipaensis TaxID=130454 RepID=UPI0007AF47D6|nr:nuclear polyadenylated RNA-binding protein 3 [Arachis ipaensis]XP_025642383.1 nuclear polyadenylated RNA-binding protein 3 [Arachis hypogaea]QHN99220.1 nuclear polyadenylated RNA-binding protein 3-like [Arachis hypogaea]